MKNAFFTAALKKAALISGKPGRLVMLVTRLTAKLREVDWQKVKTANVRDNFNVLARVIKAYASGRYRDVPWKTLLVIVAAAIYFVNPVDLIPDLIPVLGFTDDFGILVMVYRSVSQEIDKFLAWEQSQITHA